MQRFIQKHSKKFLAFFMIILMVAFLLPSSRLGGATQNDPIRGRLGDTPYRASDARRGEVDWQLLSQNLRVAGQERAIPIGVLLGDPSRQQLQNGDLPFLAVRQHPEAFGLLLKEAEAMGIVISPIQRQEFLQNQVTMADITTPDAQQAAERAVGDMLAVNAAFERVASVAKVPAPLRDWAVNREAAQVSLDVVQFDPNGPTTAAVGPTSQPASQPSATQLQAQFDKYADTPPNRPTDTNPLGFGYQVPARVELEYLSYTDDQLKQAVLSKPPGDASNWDVAARRYYYEHTDQFQSTTQPAAAAAQPTDSTFGGLPKLGLGPTSQPTTAPTTQPFEAVRQQAIDAASEHDIASLRARVATFLAAKLAGDFQSAMATTLPATAAAATSNFASPGYLQTIADTVQSQYGFEPTVVTSHDSAWTAVSDIATLPGVGHVTELASSAAAAVAHGTPRLYEFVKPVTTTDGVTYAWRFTGAENAHRPASLDEVRAAVTADVAKSALADAAKASADALVHAAARKSFSDVAIAGGFKVVSVGPINAQAAMSGSPITGLPTLEPAATSSFISQSLALLSSTILDAAGHPIGTITLPNSGKVLAAVVRQSTDSTPSDAVMLEQMMASQELRQQIQEAIGEEWFNYDRLVARTKWVESKGPRE